MNRIANRALLFAFFLTFIAAGTPVRSQNNSFQGGETLSYDLYFKFGLLNTKAGTTTLEVFNSSYGGQSAYKMVMTARSIGAASKIFSLNDTMISYMAKNMRPLEYIKEAREGDDFTQERITYSYSGKNTRINTRRVKNGKLKFDERLNTSGAIYDMMSILYYARTIDYSRMQNGGSAKVSFLSGKNLVHMNILYEGIKTMAANNGHKYNCIKLRLIINDKAFADKKDAMQVYLSNDSNRVPIQIESRLKIGATRAVLKSFRGLRH